MNIKNKLNYSVSNFDIGKYIIDANIIKYSELANYCSIDSVFSGNNYVILLIESGKRSGHWVALIRYDNCIEQFDSYSSSIDHELSFIDEKMKEKLNETNHYLTKLLNKSSYKIVVNKYKFQSEIDGTNTCGKHVILRLLMFCCNNMNLNDYINFFKDSSKKLKLNNDEFVSKIITF